MSTTGRSADGVADAESVAAAIREAGFVRVVSHADGASLSAAGVLARGLCDVPFQLSVARTDADAAATLAAVGDDRATVAFGFAPDALARHDADASPSASVDGASAVRCAAAVVRDLGGSPFEPLVLAGLRAAGDVPTADDAAIERRPGVGIPTEDLGDGLAHSTLLHGDFSGDEGRAGAALAELGLPATLDATAHRRLASHVAMVTTDGPAPSRSTEALQRSLQPHVHGDCPFATVEGAGDVLDSLSRGSPGLGVAVAVGGLDRTAALDAWRTHAARVHAAVASANVPADAGDHVVSVSDVDADPVAVARLLRDFVTDAPNVLVADDAGAALATADADAPETLADADADAIGGTASLAYTTTDDVDALVARVRGVL